MKKRISEASSHTASRAENATREASGKSMGQYFSRDLAHGGCCWVAFCHRKDARIFLHFLRVR